MPEFPRGLRDFLSHYRLGFTIFILIIIGLILAPAGVVEIGRFIENYGITDFIGYILVVLFLSIIFVLVGFGIGRVREWK